MKRGPKPRYNELIATAALEDDPAQASIVDQLQQLHEALANYGTGRKIWGGKKVAPRGLYIWGEVGRGKTALMDLFFNHTSYKSKRRLHFHEFMIEAHGRISHWRSAPENEKKRHPAFDRKAPDDPIPLAAHDISRDGRLLCFDEFQVNDIADAMILGRLFTAMFAIGVVVVTTSNRKPDDLYKDGLNRQLFLPFIDLFKNHLDVAELVSTQDYRLAKLSRAPVYYSPLGAAADDAMDAAWNAMIGGAEERHETLFVKSRRLHVPRSARASARFAFPELCEEPLGSADYLTLTRHYGAIYLDHIPIMGPEKRNEARRFVTLVDALYDTKTKLVCSADGAPHELYPHGDGSFEFGRTASRLVEMQSRDYLAAARTDAETS